MRKWQWAFAVTAAVWTLSLPAASFAASHPGAQPLRYAFALTIYAIGRLVCHQRPERSFHLWAAQLPVCARCLGLYVGAALSAAVTVVASRPERSRNSGVRTPAASVFRRTFRTTPSTRHVTAILLAAALPTALTLLYEWTTGSTPTNVVRAATALSLGGVVAVIVLRGLGQTD